jgi:hypothetical protein
MLENPPNCDLMSQLDGEESLILEGVHPDRKLYL